jgi:hypothetical protein
MTRECPRDYAADCTPSLNLRIPRILGIPGAGTETVKDCHFCHRIFCCQTSTVLSASSISHFFPEGDESVMGLNCFAGAIEFPPPCIFHNAKENLK